MSCHLHHISKTNYNFSPLKITVKPQSSVITTLSVFKWEITVPPNEYISPVLSIERVTYIDCTLNLISFQCQSTTKPCDKEFPEKKIILTRFRKTDNRNCVEQLLHLHTTLFVPYLHSIFFWRSFYYFHSSRSDSFILSLRFIFQIFYLQLHLNSVFYYEIF